jgi:hypothetical protein
LRQSPIGEPNYLFESVIKEFACVLVVRFPEEKYTTKLRGELKGGSGREGKLEDAIVFEGVRDVGAG